MWMWIKTKMVTFSLKNATETYTKAILSWFLSVMVQWSLERCNEYFFKSIRRFVSGFECFKRRTSSTKDISFSKISIIQRLTNLSWIHSIRCEHVLTRVTLETNQPLAPFSIIITILNRLDSKLIASIPYPLYPKVNCRNTIKGTYPCSRYMV